MLYGNGPCWPSSIVVRDRYDPAMPQARYVLASGAAALTAFVGLAPASVQANPYPLSLTTAVRQAFRPNHVAIRRACEFSYGTRELYAFARVRRDNGTPGVAAFQFINTAGWFLMWKDGKVQRSVPSSFSSSVRRKAAQMGARCL